MAVEVATSPAAFSIANWIIMGLVGLLNIFVGFTVKDFKRSQEKLEASMDKKFEEVKSDLKDNAEKVDMKFNQAQTTAICQIYREQEAKDLAKAKDDINRAGHKLQNHIEKDH